MSRNVELSLPNPELMTEWAAEVHEAFAAKSLDYFVDDMFGKTIVSEFGSVIDMRAKDEGDSKKAIILPLPFGNGYSPAMHIRARFMQLIQPEDTRLVVIPNNTKNETYYDLGNNQDDAIERLGNTILMACNSLGIEEIVISGYSQGASVGAVMLERSHGYDIDVKGASLGDPADVVERDKKQLAKDFRGTGLTKLNRAINDSGIPALSEAQRSSGLMELPSQLIMFAGVAGAAKEPNNQALHESMTQNTFSRRVRRAPLDEIGPVNVVRMAESKVCPEDLDRQLWHTPVELTVVQGYGHEGGDNIVDLALRTAQVNV